MKETADGRCVVEAADESFQPRSDDLLWSESAYFPFLIPERSISGWIYFFHRPNMQLSMGGIALWDPSGDSPADCLYYDWGEILPMPAGVDMFAFSLANGLTVRCIEPLREFHLAYEAADCQAELRWRASDAPFVAKWGKASTSNDWATGHYEQRGRISGTIVLRGERLTIDSWSNRDRSWGPRRYAQNPGGDFPWAVASPDGGFHVLATNPAPRDADLREVGPEQVIFGWYRRDGELSECRGGTRRTVRRGPDGRPLEVEVRATDGLGRELVARGTCVNWLKWQGYASLFQWWCLVRWEFDGQIGWGEVMEYYPREQGRRFLRSFRAQPNAQEG